MLENHQAICNGLREALKRTMQYSDLLDLVYVREPKDRSYVLEGVNASIQRVTAAGA